MTRNKLSLSFSRAIIIITKSREHAILQVQLTHLLQHPYLEITFGFKKSPDPKTITVNYVVNT